MDTTSINFITYCKISYINKVHKESPFTYRKYIATIFLLDLIRLRFHLQNRRK